MNKFAESPSKTGIFWFNNNLRLSDNSAFIRASQNVESLICVYCLDPALLQENEFGVSSLGSHRAQFLLESLLELNNSLLSLGNSLHVYFSNPVDALCNLIKEYKVSSLYTAKQVGFREIQDVLKIQAQFSALNVFEIETNTLFDLSALPFSLNDLPPTFTKFRKKVEKQSLRQVEAAPKIIPTSPLNKLELDDSLAIKALRSVAACDALVIGGESAAHEHLNNYFSNEFPAQYKKTRNSLEGWNNSTKFSFWLANGCISPLQIMQALRLFEDTVKKNESTYWIYFELLWREYFQWYALLHGRKLFLHKGIQTHALNDSFNKDTYEKWCEGKIGYDIVDACMRELNATGYMSNRGRQIVASCFVNELNLDWRYGAAYFEKMLIDYDVASNWGNWQYLAGVGADSQGKRHFNLEKQAAIHDPQGIFRAKWI